MKMRIRYMNHFPTPLQLRRYVSQKTCLALTVPNYARREILNI